MTLSIQVNLLPDGIWVAEIWHAHEQIAEIRREIGSEFLIEFYNRPANPAAFSFDEFIETLNKAKGLLVKELERAR